MTTRPFNLELDYPMLRSWWMKHNTPVLPEVFLPAIGLVAEGAMGFLFVPEKTEGGIGVIEFTTTNPEASAKIRLTSVKAIYEGLEKLAFEKGCASLMSFVAQGKGESHIMDKMGWADATGTPHLIYCKALCH